MSDDLTTRSVQREMIGDLNAWLTIPRGKGATRPDSQFHADRTIAPSATADF